MKKILLLTICCVCLCGCGRNKEEIEKTNEKSTNSSDSTSSIIKEKQLGTEYSFEQVNYYCSLYTYSNGKMISSQSFRFYFDEKGNTTKIFFLATYSDGTNQKFWKEPDDTCNTYQKAKESFNTGSWNCAIFVNN